MLDFCRRFLCFLSEYLLESVKLQALLNCYKWRHTCDYLLYGVCAHIPHTLNKKCFGRLWVVNTSHDISWLNSAKKSAEIWKNASSSEFPGVCLILAVMSVIAESRTVEGKERSQMSIAVDLYYISSALILCVVCDKLHISVALFSFSLSTVMFGSWFDHVKGWLKAKDQDHIFYISYEEMIQVSNLASTAHLLYSNHHLFS